MLVVSDMKERWNRDVLLLVNVNVFEFRSVLTVSVGWLVVG